MNLLYRWGAGVVLLAGCGEVGGSAPAQGVTLEAKLPATFTQVSNVVELGGGRVAFAGDRQFLMADLVSGKVDTIGVRSDTLGEGAPASVYKFAGWVAHLGGDTVALVDFAAIRTTLWNERGQPLAALPLPPVGGATPVLTYDHSGFGYKTDYRSLLGSPEPGAPVVRADSVPVIRIQLGSGRVDTVANLAAPVLGEAKFGEQVQQVATIFGPNDLFGALPDGRVWVARARENRVDWRGPGGVWIHGTPRDFEKVPVTEADKSLVLARIRAQAAGRLPDSLQLHWPFAGYKPPFDHATATPSGEVWLQRSRALDATEYVYDVYGPDTRWKRAVKLPPDVLLAGFGKGGVIYGVVKEGERRTVGRLREK
ncbi:MAG: hypothetical protein ACREOF_08625 [Gemmatimonadales bacterium]